MCKCYECVLYLQTDETKVTKLTSWINKDIYWDGIYFSVESYWIIRMKEFIKYIYEIFYDILKIYETLNLTFGRNI